MLKLKGSYPYALIIDGVIQEDTLKQIKKDSSFILARLRLNNLRVEDIFYAFYKKGSIYIIKKSELNK